MKQQFYPLAQSRAYSATHDQSALNSSAYHLCPQYLDTNHLHPLYASQIRSTKFVSGDPFSHLIYAPHLPPITFTYTNKSYGRKLGINEHQLGEHIFYSALHERVETMMSDDSQCKSKLDEMRLYSNKLRIRTSDQNQALPVNPIKDTVTPDIIKSLTQSLLPKTNTNAYNHQSLHYPKTDRSEHQEPRLLSDSYKQNKSLSQNKEENHQNDQSQDIRKRDMYHSMLEQSHNNRLKLRFGVQLDDQISQSEQQLSDLRRQFQEQKRKFNLERSEMCIKQIENQSIRREVERLRKKRIQLQIGLQQKEREVMKLQKKLRTQQSEKKNSFSSHINWKEQFDVKEGKLRSLEQKIKMKGHNLIEENEKMQQRSQQIKNRRRELEDIERKMLELENHEKILHELRGNKPIEKKIQMFVGEDAMRKELEQRMRQLEKREGEVLQMKKQLEQKQSSLLNNQNDEICSLSSKKSLLEQSISEKQSQFQQLRQQHDGLKLVNSQLAQQSINLQHLIAQQKESYTQILSQNKRSQEKFEFQNSQSINKLSSQKERLSNDIKILEETLKQLHQQNHRVSRELENKSMNVKIMNENVKKIKKQEEKYMKEVADLQLQIRQCEKVRNDLKREIQEKQVEKIRVSKIIEEEVEKSQQICLQNSRKQNSQKQAGALALQALQSQINKLNLSKTALAEQIKEQQQNQRAKKLELYKLEQQRNGLISQIDQDKRQLAKLEELLQNKNQIETAAGSRQETRNQELNTLQGESAKVTEQNNRLTSELLKTVNDRNCLNEQFERLLQENRVLLSQKQRLMNDYNALGSQFDNLKRASGEVIGMMAEIEMLKHGNNCEILKVEIERKNAQLTKLRNTIRNNEQLLSKNLKNSERILREYEKLEKKYSELLKRSQGQSEWKQEAVKIMEKSLSEFMLTLARMHDANDQDYSNMTHYRNTLRKAHIKLPDQSKHSDNSQWVSIFTNLLSNHITNTTRLQTLNLSENSLQKLQPTLNKLKECFLELKAFNQ